MGPVATKMKLFIKWNIKYNMNLSNLEYEQSKYRNKVSYFKYVYKVISIVYTTIKCMWCMSIYQSLTELRIYILFNLT